MNKRDVLIIWFEAPPKVSKGAFNHLSKHWGNKVYFIANTDFKEERKLTNWNDGYYGDAEFVQLSEYKDSDEIIENIINQYPNAIHVLSGFTNGIQSRVRKYLFKEGIKLGLFSERPDTMGSWFEKTIRKIWFQFKYRRAKFMFEPYVSVFLPLGQCGVNTFASFGWNRKIMYPFMYNPIIKVPQYTKSREVFNHVKFLYVGRFYYKTKGINTLMKATRYLKGDWSLDLVGGYGKDANEVIKWVETQENVNYIGSWSSEDVCKNMTEYDVVIVPSNYDGWNLLPNEAIHAGLATIVTNEAVSDEMIKISGAGLVVPAGEPREMAVAMQTAIDNPEKVNQWKSNTLNYVNRISEETVGNYLIDILDYTFYNIETMARPKCPWL